LSVAEAILLEELRDIRKMEVKEKSKMERLYKECFVTAQSHILDALSPETKRRLAEKPEYETLIDVPEPLTMYQLISKLNSGATKGKSTGEIQYERQKAYHELLMTYTESVSQFKERFNAMIKH
jgi:hypothetical protein